MDLIADANQQDRPAARTFQELIFALQRYWSQRGCVILQPYDMEVGAGTFHTATFLRSIGPEPWSAAYVQPSRRPTDGRYGDNPFRLQHYYQFQVLIKPSPPDLLELYLDSLRALGFDPRVHDVRFVEDNWESPTLGAWGLGWEVWLNGMEITQFTYFQQVGGPRLPAGQRRDHLRARAPGDVSAGRREHLRHRLDRGAAGTGHATAMCSIRTRSSSRSYNFELADTARAAAAFRRSRARLQRSCSAATAAAAGL